MQYDIALADFGSSRAEDASITMTRCGTPIYLCPEMLTGEKYDAKADVFAFGMCIYLMSIVLDKGLITKTFIRYTKLPKNHQRSL